MRIRKEVRSIGDLVLHSYLACHLPGFKRNWIVPTRGHDYPLSSIREEPPPIKKRPARGAGSYHQLPESSPVGSLPATPSSILDGWGSTARSINKRILLV